MDPIADLAALRAILAGLRGKALVLSLTAEGRGHVVSHALYPPEELEHLKAQFHERGAGGARGTNRAAALRRRRQRPTSRGPPRGEQARPARKAWCGRSRSCGFRSPSCKAASTISAASRSG